MSDDNPAITAAAAAATIAPGTVHAGPWVPRNLCDECFEEVTGDISQCQDACRLALSHAGRCDPRRESDQPCDRCGRTGSRLTEHEPQDDEEAASCLPRDITARIGYLEGIAAGCGAPRGDGKCDHADCPACCPARHRELAELTALAGAGMEVTYWVPAQYTVRLDAAAVAATLARLGWRAAAAVALRIARGQITEGDATSDIPVPATPVQAELARLARALQKNNEALDINGPAGEAGDWEEPDDYHVWVLPATPMPPAPARPADPAGPAPGSPDRITDEQVITWAAEAAAGTVTIGSLHQAHQLFDAAKAAVSGHCNGNSGHLIDSIELWPNLGTDGTPAGLLITVDLPPGTAVPVPGGTRLAARSGKPRRGPALSTLQIDLDELVRPGQPYPDTRDLAADLITGILSFARDAITARRRCLHDGELASALAAAQAVMNGGPGADEHAALYRLTCAAEAVLDAGQI